MLVERLKGSADRDNGKPGIKPGMSESNSVWRTQNKLTRRLSRAQKDFELHDKYQHASCNTELHNKQGT